MSCKYSREFTYTILAHMHACGVSEDLHLLYTSLCIGWPQTFPFLQPSPQAAQCMHPTPWECGPPASLLFWILRLRHTIAPKSTK